MDLLQRLPSSPPPPETPQGPDGGSQSPSGGTTNTPTALVSEEPFAIRVFSHQQDFGPDEILAQVELDPSGWLDPSVKLELRDLPYGDWKHLIEAGRQKESVWVLVAPIRGRDGKMRRGRVVAKKYLGSEPPVQGHLFPGSRPDG